MEHHRTGTRDEWLEARLRLLHAEKELTRLNDDVTRQRMELPWVRVDEAYRFDTEDGEATLADLFRGRSQLLVYHFMYGPDWSEGCPSCSAVADGFDETFVHLQNHDVAFTAVIARPARQAPGLSGPDGVELSVGVVRAERLQLRFRRVLHRGVGGRRRVVQLPSTRRLAARSR